MENLETKILNADCKKHVNVFYCQPEKKFGFVEKLIEAFQEVGIIGVDEGQLFDDFAAFVKLWPTKTE